MTSVINIVLACNVLNLTIWKTLHHTEDPLFGIFLEPSAVSARDYAKRAPKSPTLRNLNFSEGSPCRKWVPKLTVTSSFIDFIHLRHNSLRYTAVLHIKTSNKIYLCSRSVCRHEKSKFFVKTADWPPLLVFSGALCLVFVSICCVILVLFYGFFRCLRRFGVFFELVVHYDCIRQKRECNRNADWKETSWLGENK